ncbi:MAG TPA: VWA domain-containing protein [Pyrinomonadaceae bacterium]|nr:VWA domain-containing protein [Pyrinomonadaceae bacterium]
MPSKSIFFSSLITFALLCSFVDAISGQSQKPPQDPDVVRVDTELVQTGVMVFDKQGRFVDGLTADQFNLLVDGKPVKPSFFERVTAGTPAEERLISGSASTPTTTSSNVTTRGRRIIFFVDDLHLSLDSLGRTRSTIRHFLETQMTPDDQVAIASGSGQIGFLQQFTDNKAVLELALARLKPIPSTVRDTDQPPMTEFIATRIVNGDREAADVYIDKIIEGFATRNLSPRGFNRNGVFEMVKTRANHIVFGLDAVTKTSLSSLENLLRNSQTIAGRKLVFYVSDGFYLNSRNSDGATSQLQRVIDIAARSGSVIYTIDARGLFAPISDATGDRAFDPKGRLDRGNIGEGTLSQDGLNALAGDTGGRFLKNQNYFERWVERVLDETSNYYLLAWRPLVEEQKGANFKRIEVNINGRTDLTVRLPRGFFTGPPKTVGETFPVKGPDGASIASQYAKGPEAALISALGAPSARKGLPTILAVSFVDVPNTGPVVTASTQMATDVLGYGSDGKQTAAIDVAGVVLNDQGKPAGSFKTRLKVNPSAQADASLNPVVIYSHKLPLKPGIYQVRVAARDDQSGRVGSAAQWIEVPELGSKQLSLSSLLLNGKLIGSSQKQSGAAGQEQVQFSVDRRFPRGSHLNLLTIIYNGGRGGSNLPELETQIKISRGGQTIVNSPFRKVVVDANGDLARIPYAADIALQTLPAGRYLLEVKVSDRVAKTTASRQTTFEIE